MPRVRSGAFTLIELLVVLGVLAALAAIAMGALLTTGRQQGVAAGADLVADLLRQAWHTHRSSGIPVQLRFDAERGAITGIAAVPILAAGFERSLSEHATGLAAPRHHQDGAKRPIPGATGYGLVLDQPGLPPDVDVSVDLSPLIRQPEAGRSLMRRAGDGFHLSCRIRLPQLAGRLQGATRGSPAQALDDYDHGRRGDLYLVLGSQAAHDHSNSIAGLGVYVEARRIASQDLQNPDSTAEVLVYSWSPFAWIRGTSGVVWLPLIAAENDDGFSDHIAGGEWLELAVFYDGRHAVGLRDGREVLRREIGTIPAPAQPLLAFVGHRVLDTGTVQLAPGILDDLRVLRLGAGDAQRLPGGIRPQEDYLVTIADGRLDLSGGSSIQLLDPRGGRAEILPHADGRSEIFIHAP